MRGEQYIISQATADYKTLRPGMVRTTESSSMIPPTTALPAEIFDIAGTTLLSETADTSQRHFSGATEAFLRHGGHTRGTEARTTFQRHIRDTPEAHQRHTRGTKPSSTHGGGCPITDHCTKPATKRCFLFFPAIIDSIHVFRHRLDISGPLHLLLLVDAPLEWL